jgi:mono/diheme cytochrome c family protein
MRRTQIQLARRITGVALLVVALGCGGKVDDEEPNSAAPRAAPGAPPPYAGPAPQRARPTATPTATATAPVNPPPMQPRPLPFPSEGLEEAAARNVLMANCGSCHGPDAEPAVSGGIRFIDDWNELIEAGLIAILNSAGSRLIRVMQDGSMPPPASGLPAVTEADIDVVARYIDNPRYWPYVPTLPEVADGGTATSPVDAGADGG